MAVDAADFHLDLFMRNLGDVGVALDALPLAVHAAQEAVFQHRRRRARLRLCGRRESFQAMTAEAHLAGELGSGLIGRCALRSYVRRPQPRHCDEANEAGGDPNRDTHNTPAHTKILGGGTSVRRGHDYSALTGRLQTHTSIMIEKSTAFHPRLTFAAQELFD